jgi:hypothetical protein
MTNLEMLQKADRLIHEISEGCPKSCVSKQHSKIRQVKDIISVLVISIKKGDV